MLVLLRRHTSKRILRSLETHWCGNVFSSSFNRFSTSPPNPIAPSNSPLDKKEEDPASSAIPGAQSSDDRFIIMYTCTVCNTRSARTITKIAYYKGVVIVRCPGCNNNHLIADRLGYFEDESADIESLMKAKGEVVKRIQQPGYRLNDGGKKYEENSDKHVLELTQEDLEVLASSSKSIQLDTHEVVNDKYTGYTTTPRLSKEKIEEMKRNGQKGTSEH
jgi:mitochondrial protein import protein ZIM17